MSISGGLAGCNTQPNSPKTEQEAPTAYDAGAVYNNRSKALAQLNERAKLLKTKLVTDSEAVEELPNPPQNRSQLQALLNDIENLIEELKGQEPQHPLNQEQFDRMRSIDERYDVLMPEDGKQQPKQ